MAGGYNPEVIKREGVLDLTSKGNRPIPTKESNKTFRARYDRLKTDRQPFLERARRFSSYTVPNLYPLDTGQRNYGDGADTTGWQSFGSQAVNSVVNELVMTLFPPHTPFARLELTPEAKRILTEEDRNIIERESSLIGAQKEALLEHEKIAGRVGLGEALEHLVVGGNACLYKQPEGNLITYPLGQYVAKRDKSGELLELIIEESKAIETFEPELQSRIRNKTLQAKNNSNRKDEVNVYTSVKLVNDMYIVEQEVLDMTIGKRQRIKPDNLPFIVLRWKSNYGEDYGRSLVEQYAGDLHAIQFLSEAIAKGMILMSDVKYLVKAGATTDVDHLINSPTGEFVYGNIEDIGVLQLEKYADFTPISQVLDKYERRVGKAFMLDIMRDAERVTAYEIRRAALNMEKQLGGAYSLLAVTLQKPYFRLLLRSINFQLPDNLVSTIILTGIEALSKMGDADKYLQWSEAMATAAGLPQPVQERMKWGDFAQHTANELSYELPFIMTEKEYQEKVQADRQFMMQQQAAEAATKAAPELIKQSNK